MKTGQEVNSKSEDGAPSPGKARQQGGSPRGALAAGFCLPPRRPVAGPPLPRACPAQPACGDTRLFPQRRDAASLLAKLN